MREHIFFEAPTPWAERAVCAGLPVDLFYPSPGDRYQIGKTLLLCRSCPVRAECADHCLRTHDSRFDFGIWGGTTERDRRGFRSGKYGGARRDWTLQDVAEMIEEADRRRGVEKPGLPVRSGACG